MPVSKARKEEQLGVYNELLEASNGFAIVRTQNLSVQRIEALRTKIREVGGQYIVGKNTLVIKALQERDWVIPKDLLKGPTAIVFGKDNFPGVAKALFEFIEAEKIETTQMDVIGGVMERDLLNAVSVKAISNLPTLPELQAQLIGLIVAPATDLVSVLEAATGSVLNVVQAWEDKQNEGGEAA